MLISTNLTLVTFLVDFTDFTFFKKRANQSDKNVLKGKRVYTKKLQP